MNKILALIFFITVSQQAMSTTFEIELAKPKAVEYETIFYGFEVPLLKNPDTWCYKFNAVEKCLPVGTQMIITNPLNFIINDKYKANVKYDDLKNNKSCKEGNLKVERVNEYRPFELWTNISCVEDNNFIRYTFKYFPDIQGIALEKMFYATCSSNNFHEYKLPLLRKFNSFKFSQAPTGSSTQLKIDSPLTGEFFTSELISTKGGSINCDGDSALSITITLNEYKQTRLTAATPNKGWFNSQEDIYTSSIKKMMTELAKQNKPKF